MYFILYTYSPVDIIGNVLIKYNNKKDLLALYVKYHVSKLLNF